MERDLVERRGWLTEEEFREGLTLAQLAPGPLAAQLAIYVGWLRGRLAGATLVAIAFVAPSLVMVLGLSVLYVRYGGLPWMAAAFYGIGAAVIAIIVRSAVRLARKTLSKDWLLWAVFASNALVTAWTASEILWLFLASGLIALVARGGLIAPRLGATARVLFPLPFVALQALPQLGELFVFFAKASLVVFGSGLAVVPFLYGVVVQSEGWLNDRQFLDAVAVSMMTPGPVVITVAFIGYLVRGFTGALVAALGMFLPTYLVVVALAPWFRRISRQGGASAFVAGVTAAATGAIAGAAFVLGRRAIVDGTTITIACAALLLLHRRLHVPEPIVILLAGIAGLVLHA
jgi:chromate transporter